MTALFCLDVRRRISDKDEGIYIHDFSKSERIKLERLKAIIEIHLEIWSHAKRYSDLDVFMRKRLILDSL